MRKSSRTTSQAASKATEFPTPDVLTQAHHEVGEGEAIWNFAQTHMRELADRAPPCDASFMSSQRKHVAEEITADEQNSRSLTAKSDVEISYDLFEFL
jgi:hypothetical protein